MADVGGRVQRFVSNTLKSIPVVATVSTYLGSMLFPTVFAPLFSAFAPYLREIVAMLPATIRAFRLLGVVRGLEVAAQVSKRLFRQFAKRIQSEAHAIERAL